MKTYFNSLFLLIFSFALMSFISCKNVHTGHTQHKTEQSANDYSCPMHPEVTGKKGDKCPKCGMDLTPTKSPSDNMIKAELSTNPSSVEATQPVELKLRIQENGANYPLEVAHEKKLHLIAVSEDLTWFSHLHPTETTGGSYATTTTFPFGGRFILYADYKPAGASHKVDKMELTVHGAKNPNTNLPTTKWVSETDGYKLMLVNGNDFKSNRTQHLGIAIEKNGKNIMAKDMEPYLGAVAHVVLIGKDGYDFMHVHPTSNEKYPIHGETHFEKSGTYRMWVQFQTGGKVHTADFTVDVVAGDASSAPVDQHQHH